MGNVKIAARENNHYVLRLDDKEELIEAITAFAEKNGIASGVFWGIGAAEKATIAFYEIADKKYLEKHVAERLEIASVTGNIAMLDGKTTIHAHGVFSDSAMKAQAGHVKALTVSPTCEIFLIAFSDSINRAYDEKSGLNLLL